jgi:hypothetical protein
LNELRKKYELLSSFSDFIRSVKREEIIVSQEKGCEMLNMVSYLLYYKGIHVKEECMTNMQFQSSAKRAINV